MPNEAAQVFFDANMSSGMVPAMVLRGDDRPDLIRIETLADILESSAAQWPDRVALRATHEQAQEVTYRQLNQMADQVATFLAHQGIGPGKIVGLWCTRGVNLLVMQAGIAKSGAGWLPLDADIPPARLVQCLEDCSAAGLITCDSLAPILTAAANQPDSVAMLPPLWTAEAIRAASTSGQAIIPVADPDATVYLIYTSGSTGKPKGIAISQRNICHFLRSENVRLQINQKDIVYQGFSTAFDMSFEEIWISYLAGATLWLAPACLTTDPQSLPSVLREQKITVLHTVPTLLALFEEDVPELRIINLGGEACPEHLAQRWCIPGRTVFNSYGPSEATVTASLSVLVAGKPVTIGQPLPNYDLFIIDADITGGVRLLNRGETGELCIAGIGVGQGYIGRPELTEDKFRPLPWAAEQRFYRTGDLARIDEDGNIVCLGRADDQVKIRGFRVELGEIERRLAAEPGVGTVAVVLRQDDGIDQLIAFVVPDHEQEDSQTAARTDPDSRAGSLPAAWRQALGLSLPAYMVPSRFELLDDMPRLTSGKIDRNQLKRQPLAIVSSAAGEHDLPRTQAETDLFAALAALFPGQPLRRDNDFFTDLGGHSLLAAKLVSRLRTSPDYTGVRLASLYQARTLSAIAAELEQCAVQMAAARQTAEAAAIGNTGQPGQTADYVPRAWRRWRCAAAQAATLPFMMIASASQWLAPFFTYQYFTGDPGDSMLRATACSAGVFILAVLFQFALAITTKRVITGRLSAGRYPLWGMVFFRWWLSERLIESAPTYLLAGSTLQRWWLRALGAQIGQNTYIGSVTIRVPELINIGNGVSAGNAVMFSNARVTKGQLILGKISLRDNSSVGSYCVLEPDTTIAEYGHLEGQSTLRTGETVPESRIWRGSPARDEGAFDRSTLPARPVLSKTRKMLLDAYFGLTAAAVAVLFFLPEFPSFLFIDWIDNSDRFPMLQTSHVGLQILKYFLLAFPAAAILIFCTALLVALIRQIVLPSFKPGLYPVYGRQYCAKWLVNQMQESSLQVLYGVFATIYSATWFRMLGAKVGKGAEISTVMGITPSLLVLGEDTFVADAVMMGDEKIDGGWLDIHYTSIARRAFVGNGAFVPDGAEVPENSLIGVLSCAPANHLMKSGETWVGTPPMSLPAREITGGFSEALTYRPSPFRRLARGLIEGIRIVFPHAFITGVGYTVVLNTISHMGDGHWLTVSAMLLMTGLLFSFGTFATVLALKWLLIGRYRRRNVPMWTVFVWLSEGITSLYEGMVIPNFMRFLRGTAWLPLAFNLLGARIARNVYMDTTDITEFDCVHIGEGSEINALSCPQTHLFEDRIMKIDDVHIGQRVTIGVRSTVLYGARVGNNVTLGSLTLVMKGEMIPPRTEWHGSPAIMR